MSIRCNHRNYHWNCFRHCHRHFPRHWTTFLFTPSQSPSTGNFCSLLPFLI